MHYCILISCLVLFTFCSLAQNPDKCCFSFSNLEIPEREVESYMTNLECPRHGIMEMCVDSSELWDLRLKNLVDTRSLKDIATMYSAAPYKMQSTIC
uniref:Chemokine interleukin-8-like domain-containing protein n=1 Tax=Sinocyclocheilus rhinocerous TaxID=307959 RepID=A0A673LME4_9TELE